MARELVERPGYRVVRLDKVLTISSFPFCLRLWSCRYRLTASVAARIITRANSIIFDYPRCILPILICLAVHSEKLSFGLFYFRTSF